MSLIKPFCGLRPAAEFIDDVISPPSNVLNREEGKLLIRGRPLSFLHITKPEIDFPDDVSQYDESVYERASQVFFSMREKGVMSQDGQPVFYVYRMTVGDHEQVGLIALASLEAYEQGRIRQHERTDQKVIDDCMRYVYALHAETSPATLFYKPQAEVESILKKTIQRSPEYDEVTLDGVRHEFWMMTNQENISHLSFVFSEMEYLYVADGHHRFEAAKNMLSDTSHFDYEKRRYIFSALFPANQLRVLSYHRAVKDLNGLSIESFLTSVKNNFTITPSIKAVNPTQGHAIGMYLAGEWYELVLKGGLLEHEALVSGTAVSILSDFILNPILGIDKENDGRIEYVPGVHGLDRLVQYVDSEEMTVAFSVKALSLNTLLRIVDAEQMLPLKSTWFEPKLADGLVSYLL